MRTLLLKFLQRSYLTIQQEGPDNKLLLFKSSALNFPAGKSHADLDPLNQIADQYNNYFRSLRGALFAKILTSSIS